MHLENVRLKIANFYDSMIRNTFRLLITCAFLFGYTCLVVLLSELHGVNYISAGQKQSIVVEQYGYTNKPIVSRIFHGDITMSSKMRQSVEFGVQDLNRVSCGMARVKIIWDYEPRHDLLKTMFWGDNILLQANSKDLSKSFGRSASELLGMTQATSKVHGSPIWLFLVNDNLVDDPILTEWTMLHELGHAIGMEHVEDGIMNAYAPMYIQSDKIPLWSYSDCAEFCRIYHCDPMVMARCN